MNEPTVSQALAAFLRAPALRGARVGVVVDELASGRGWPSTTPSVDLVPGVEPEAPDRGGRARALGPGARFETPILIEGELADGVLDGTLWVVGQGDPSLVSESLWKLAEEIRLRGMREIRGGIGVDVSNFDAQRFHPDWEPVSSRAYYAPIAAFCANYSSFRIDVAPGDKVGEPAQSCGSRPRSRTSARSAEAVTLRGGGQLGARRRRAARRQRRERARDRRGLRRPRTEHVLARDRAARALRGGAAARSSSRRRECASAPRVRIGPRRPRRRASCCASAGEPLALQVRLLDKYSNNFVAEQLTKLLGAELYGAPAHLGEGRARARRPTCETTAHRRSRAR